MANRWTNIRNFIEKKIVNFLILSRVPGAAQVYIIIIVKDTFAVYPRFVLNHDFSLTARRFP